MNREIEFRVWDIEKNIMLYETNWWEIVSKNEDAYYSDECYPYYFLLSNLFELDVNFAHNRYIVMQYTGLKDKNGNKIFEGDIVKPDNDYINELGIITWNNKNSSFQIKGISSSSMTHLERMLLIGNIYENRELLEVNK